MSEIKISYDEAQAIFRIVYQLKLDAIESNHESWSKQCDHYLKLLDGRINESVLNHA